MAFKHSFGPTVQRQFDRQRSHPSRPLLGPQRNLKKHSRYLGSIASRYFPGLDSFSRQFTVSPVFVLRLELARQFVASFADYVTGLSYLHYPMVDSVLAPEFVLALG